MNLREIFGLEAGTVRTVNKCINLFARASALGLTWAGLLGLNVVLNWIIGAVVRSVGGSERVELMLSNAFLAFVVTFATAVLVTGLRDVIRLTWYDLRGRDPDEQRVRDEDKRDG